MVMSRLIKTKNLYKAHQLVANLKKSTILEFKQNYPAWVDNVSLRFSQQNLIYLIKFSFLNVKKIYMRSHCFVYANVLNSQK